MPSTAAKRERRLRRLVVFLLVLHLGAAALGWHELARHALELVAAIPEERGALTADEFRSPIPAAGQHLYDQRLRELGRSGRVQRSPVAYAWQFLVENRKRLEPSDRVIVDPPTTIPYYYGTFLWYPVAVELWPEPGIVRDEASVAAVERDLPADERRNERLARMGYTHRLEVDARGLELIELPRVVGPGPEPK